MITTKLHAVLAVSVSVLACDGLVTDDVERTEHRAANVTMYGSCEAATGDYCGGPSADRCWCDDWCAHYGDCCDDVDAVCNAAACCDVAAHPGGIEGAHCCADGTWKLDIGDGNPSVCDSHGGLGPVCEATCCDMADHPGGIEGAHCCSDGHWQGGIGNGDPGVCDPYGGVGPVCE